MGQPPLVFVTVENRFWEKQADEFEESVFEVSYKHKSEKCGNDLDILESSSEVVCVNSN